MTKKIIISLALITAVVMGVLYGKGLLSVHQGLEPPASLSALVLEKTPKTAPIVHFAGPTGDRHALDAFRGRYVLLNLWATWCAPCVSELPALGRLSRFVPGLRVLVVNTADRAAVDAAAFLKSHNAGGLTAYRDNEKVMMKSFGAYGLPMTVLIDPQGKIVAKAEGPAEWGSAEAVKYFKRITGT
ncbi:MAG TPA: TlpA disulfide reductase family protein [Rhizomicrobium sp.]|nr:TlpA disulfide reductase family protein [Rhizomicrobium sp.]